MPLDLTLFSPDERQIYQDLGSRFDPEDALAQANSTLSALAGGTRELMAHDFLLEDQATLRAARQQLDEVHHGGGEGPVDPDAVPVLAGLVITLSREADKAAQAAAKAAYSKSNNMGDLTLAHWFRMVAKPKEGSEPPLKQAGSLKELFILAAEDEKRALALRELRRAREREQTQERNEPTAPKAEDQTAAPYRAVPRRKKAPKISNKSDSGPLPRTPERIAWESERDAGQEERRVHGRSALKSAGLLALGFGGLVLAGERDSEQHTRANSKLGAMGAILTLVAFFSLTRALVYIVVASFRLGTIKRREPVSRR
jgi:hypothetical protein